MDLKDTVKMVHPSLPQDQVPAVVARSSFEKAWSKKGWTLADESGTAPEPEPHQSEDEQLTLDDLSTEED